MQRAVTVAGTRCMSCHRAALSQTSLPLYTSAPAARSSASAAAVAASSAGASATAGADASAGAITGADDYELPDGEWILLTGNFRNKNNNDILLREQATGELRVFVPLADDADGTSNSEATPITTISPSYKLKAVADMNGDGQSDLVWQGSEILIELMDQDTNGDYVKLSRQRVGFASGTVVNARDWNDDGQVDLMMRRGNRTYYQYLKLTNGYLYGGGSRDLGNAPGPVQDISQR